MSFIPCARLLFYTWTHRCVCIYLPCVHVNVICAYWEMYAESGKKYDTCVFVIAVKTVKKNGRFRAIQNGRNEKSNTHLNCFVSIRRRVYPLKSHCSHACMKLATEAVKNYISVC